MTNRTLYLLLLTAGSLPVHASQLWYVITDAKSVTTNGTQQGTAEMIYNTNAGATTNISNFGATLTNSGTGNTLGLFSSIDQTSASLTNFTAASFAAADLSMGTLKASVSNSGNGPFATSQAVLSDTLTYNNPGGGAINVGINYVVHGSTYSVSPGNNPSANSVDLPLLFGSAQIDPQWNQSPASISEHFDFGWTTEHVTQLDATDFAFSGTITVSGVNPVVQLMAAINLNCSATGSCAEDFSHTGTLNLILPQGVTYTSASGVFLTQTAATPEPSTFGLGLVGLGMAGIFINRRRRGI